MLRVSTIDAWPVSVTHITGSATWWALGREYPSARHLACDHLHPCQAEEWPVPASSPPALLQYPLPGSGLKPSAQTPQGASSRGPWPICWTPPERGVRVWVAVLWVLADARRQPKCLSTRNGHIGGPEQLGAGMEGRPLPACVFVLRDFFLRLCSRQILLKKIAKRKKKKKREHNQVLETILQACVKNGVLEVEGFQFFFL